MYLCLSKPIECFTISSEGRKQTFEGSVSSYSLVETNKMDDQECIKSVNFDSGNSGNWKLTETHGLRIPDERFFKYPNCFGLLGRSLE